jgi:dihydroorotase-like cyclic amidohydrolase
MTTLHFQNARLIDPEAGTDAIGSLTVKNGTILARDGKAPKGATVVDCGGKCLAPGIVDLGRQDWRARASGTRKASARRGRRRRRAG